VRLLQSVLVHLLRDKVLAGDLHLLLLRVPSNLDDLHSVAQRRQDGVQHVRRGDKQHARQVEWNFQVVVPECPVLFGVKHFQQGG